MSNPATRRAPLFSHNRKAPNTALSNLANRNDNRMNKVLGSSTKLKLKPNLKPKSKPEPVLEYIPDYGTQEMQGIQENSLEDNNARFGVDPNEVDQPGNNDFVSENEAVGPDPDYASENENKGYDSDSDFSSDSDSGSVSGSDFGSDSDSEVDFDSVIPPIPSEPKNIESFLENNTQRGEILIYKSPIENAFNPITTAYRQDLSPKDCYIDFYIDKNKNMLYITHFICKTGGKELLYDTIIHLLNDRYQFGLVGLYAASLFTKEVTLDNFQDLLSKGLINKKGKFTKKNEKDTQRRLNRNYKAMGFQEIKKDDFEQNVITLLRTLRGIFNEKGYRYNELSSEQTNDKGGSRKSKTKKNKKTKRRQNKKIKRKTRRKQNKKTKKFKSIKK